MAYKLVKKTERKYYKYLTESWTQPFLTSNGTMGGNTPAASASNTHGSYDGQPWRAFDGVGSAGWATNNAAPPQWIMFYNPTPFQLQSVTITPRTHLLTAYTVQGSNDGVTFEDIQSFQLPWWYIDPVVSSIDSENQGMYKYYRFYITMTADNNVDVMQIGLSGIVRSKVESDETDYDYYEDVINYKLVKTVGDSIPFVQTPLTSNGTIGGTEPACSATSSYTDWQPYRAFDDDITTWWGPASRTDCTLYYYNPNPIKLSSVYIDFGGVLNECFSNIKIYGGDSLNNLQELANYDNSSKLSPITIPISTDNNYRYFAFELTKPTAQTWGRIYDIKLEGITTPEVVWTQPPFADWIGNNDGVWDTSRLYTCTCDGSHNPTDQGGVASLAGSNNGWHTTTSYLPHWVGYYTDPIRVSKFGFQVDGTTTYIPTRFHWDGSNDGNTWTELGSFTRNNTLTTYEEYTIPEANRGMYKYHRLYITSGNNSRYCFICNVNITATKEGASDTYNVISRNDNNEGEVSDAM